MARIPVTRAVIVADRTARDPPATARKREGRVRVPRFKVVLRKDGYVRVAETEIASPRAAVAVAMALVGDMAYEHMVAILLNNQGKIVGATIIATSGQVGAAQMAPRAVFTAAIAHGAASVILAHNHPSGNPRASEDDLRMRDKVRENSAMIGIPVLDFLIVTPDPDRWSSFA